MASNSKGCWSEAKVGVKEATVASKTEREDVPRIFCDVLGGLSVVRSNRVLGGEGG